ncbi:MAG: anthranilate synthase component 1 [Proteobacteria bacterium]|nr:anthranilate synthase component 1 [Pseudomonadota bacterium]
MTSAPAPGPGEVRTFASRLPYAPDPVELFGALGAPRPGVVLDSTAREHHLARRSIVLTKAAVTLSCRERTVTLQAHSDNGNAALEHAAGRLADRASTLSKERGKLIADFGPRPDEGLLDTERLQEPSPLDALRAVTTGYTPLGEPEPYAVLAAGVFAYDLIDTVESLPGPRLDPLDYPNFLFWLAEELVIVEHPSETCRVITTVFGGDGDRCEVDHRSHARVVDTLRRLRERPSEAQLPSPPRDRVAGSGPVASFPDLEVSLSDEQYARQVAELKERIFEGEVFQIVPSRVFGLPCPNPLAAYRALRVSNPSPHMFFVAANDHTLFGTSPETAVEVRRQGAERMLRLRPIAGTRGRAEDADEDDRLEAELRLDTKEIAEHMMLVDLARNDAARVCLPGQRSMRQLLGVDRYARVMHLVSTVCGTLRPELDALHALEATLNMGTVVGAPKLRAAELLREVEATKRGPYAGSVGYFTNEGELDTALTIRAALVKEGSARVQAGAGVVADSDPMAEAIETRRKAQALLDALKAVAS